MNPSTLETSARFLRAAASYWGVPPDQLILGGQHGAIDGVFSVQLTIALTPDDLAGIVKRMHTMAQDDAVAAICRSAEARGHSVHTDGSQRAGMSVEKSAQFDAEGLTGTWVDHHVKPGASVKATIEEPTEGVGGRKVLHVDVPDDEPVTGGELPAAVWVYVSDLVGNQRQLCSDGRHVFGAIEPEALVQVDLLTSEQRAKYCPEDPLA